MIVITGAAGFIGSVVLKYFNDKGYKDILAIDKLGDKAKWKNITNKRFADFGNRDDFINALYDYHSINAIIHMGACTDTSEFDLDYLMSTNFEYSKKLFLYAKDRKIPFLYASSAATYGAGEHGYSDKMNDIYQLTPLNPYGFSKQLFDQWVVNQSKTPPYWAGFKFFNVYGPNEYHKGRMASVIFHFFNQIRENGEVKLFKSYLDNYEHGEQKRDFVYVKDVAKMIYYFFENRMESGFFNVGTGRARSFNDLAMNVIANVNSDANIKYIDMPSDIKDKYQYFTEAEMTKVRDVGYKEKFYSLEDGIREYVNEFLMKNYKIF